MRVAVDEGCSFLASGGGDEGITVGKALRELFAQVEGEAGQGTVGFKD